MSYIGRFFSWMIGGIIHIVKEIIMFLIRQIISFLRFAWPHILRAVAASLAIAFQMCLLNLLALVQPVRSIAQQKGREWSDRAVREGWFRSLHQLTLTRLLYFVAFAAINLGFVINLFTAVFITIWFWEHGDWLISLF